MAVRDRRRGAWLLAHAALSRRIGGIVRPGPGGEPEPTRDAPRVGDALLFRDDGPELLTSAVHAIVHPTPETVASYPF